MIETNPTERGHDSRTNAKEKKTDLSVTKADLFHGFVGTDESKENSLCMNGKLFWSPFEKDWSIGR